MSFLCLVYSNQLISIDRIIFISIRLLDTNRFCCVDGYNFLFKEKVYKSIESFFKEIYNDNKIFEIANKI